MAQGDRKDLLEQAKADYKLADDAWGPNRKDWLEDTKFCYQPGAQWPEAVRRDRSIAGKERPCLEVDKLGQYVRQVVNDGRQNRPSVKVRPVDGEGDPEVAEAFQGIIRHICDRSKADQAFDTALEHAVVGGFGFFRIITEYAHENTFNQEIRIKRVRNPLAVMLDPNAQEADGSDARFGFFIDEVPKDDFKKRYPNAKVTDWEAGGFKDGWADEKNVKVCEYFYKVEEDAELHLLADGTSIKAEDYERARTEIGPDLLPAIEETRTIPTCKVKWCRLTGAEVLEENDWLGKFIPIIPVYGNESDIDGRVTYSGLIRKAKDAQRLYNFSRSAFAESVALAPKAKFVAAAGQIEGFEDQWEDANKSSEAVLPYNPVDIMGTVLPPPRREPGPEIPEAFARDMQLSEHDIQGALGMYNSSLGEKSNEKSGRAIMARQREGDTATFHYQDNQSRAIGYLGLQLVDLAPKVYDSRRVVRILGEDGKATAAMVDPDQDSAVEKRGSMTIYNLNAGEYDVSVSAGPSYTTKRQEALDAGMQLAQANPQLWGFIGDIIVRNADWPGADEIADRLKAMLPPPIQEAERAKDAGQDPKVLAVQAQAKQMLDQASQQIQQMGGALQQLQQENEALKQQVESKMADTAIKAEGAQTNQYKAETERMTALAPAITPDLVAQIVQQTVAEIMAQPAPQGPPTQPPPQAPSGAFFTPGV